MPPLEPVFPFLHTKLNQETKTPLFPEDRSTAAVFRFLASTMTVVPSPTPFPYPYCSDECGRRRILSLSLESAVSGLGNLLPRFLMTISSLDRTSTLRFSRLFKGCRKLRLSLSLEEMIQCMEWCYSDVRLGLETNVFMFSRDLFSLQFCPSV
ncbi:hypothetical protein LINPERHAP1_LOCUS61 [Linum perenne]